MEREKKPLVINSVEINRSFYTAINIHDIKIKQNICK